MRYRRTTAIAAIAAIIAVCQPCIAPADDIYTIDGKAVPSIATSDPIYAAFPEFKAMAVNDDGTAFLSIRQCSAAKAAEDALGDCRRASADQTCRLAAVGNADASSLDDAGVAQLIRLHSRTIAKLPRNGSGSTAAIPVALSAKGVPYLSGFAMGRLYYDPSTPCVGAVVAQTKEGLICDGVWQFRRRLSAAEYPAEGDLDFDCSNGVKMTGTYVTIVSGLGAARVTDGGGHTLFAVYGPDVNDGAGEGVTFHRLWGKRALFAPEATIFQQPEAP